LFLSAISFLGACQAVKNDLHPLTHELLATGIQFNKADNSQEGFDTYSASPDSKAFAASVDRAGLLHAWGKA
jgi:hypothetical protein